MSSLLALELALPPSTPVLSASGMSGGGNGHRGSGSGGPGGAAGSGNSGGGRGSRSSISGPEFRLRLPERAGVPAQIDGQIIMTIAKALRDAKIVIEFRGETITRWTGDRIRDATDKAPTSYGPKHIFKSTASLAVPSDLTTSTSINKSISTPFHITLPSAASLPPTFDDPRGSIYYILRVTVTWQDSIFSAVKSSRTVEAPCIVTGSPPELIQLLQSPLPLIRQEPYHVHKVMYSLLVPRQAVKIGDALDAEVSIVSLPVGRFIKSLEFSIRTVMEFRGPTVAAVLLPSLAEVKDMSWEERLAAALSTGQPMDWQRAATLIPDVNRVLPSIDSPLIGVCHYLHMEIHLDGNLPPTVADIPIFILPAPPPVEVSLFNKAVPVKVSMDNIQRRRQQEAELTSPNKQGGGARDIAALATSSNQYPLLVPFAGQNQPEHTSDKPTPDMVMLVWADFEPRMPDEIELRVGHNVVLNVLHDDGWAHGTNITTGMSGMLPVAVLVKDPNPPSLPPSVLPGHKTTGSQPSVPIVGVESQSGTRPVSEYSNFSFTRTNTDFVRGGKRFVDKNSPALSSKSDSPKINQEGVGPESVNSTDQDQGGNQSSSGQIPRQIATLMAAPSTTTGAPTTISTPTSPSTMNATIASGRASTTNATVGDSSGEVPPLPHRKSSIRALQRPSDILPKIDVLGTGFHDLLRIYSPESALHSDTNAPPLPGVTASNEDPTKNEAKAPPANHPMEVPAPSQSPSQDASADDFADIIGEYQNSSSRPVSSAMSLRSHSIKRLYTAPQQPLNRISSVGAALAPGGEGEVVEMLINDTESVIGANGPANSTTPAPGGQRESATLPQRVSSAVSLMTNMQLQNVSDDKLGKMMLWSPMPGNRESFSVALLPPSSLFDNLPPVPALPTPDPVSLTIPEPVDATPVSPITNQQNQQTEPPRSTMSVASAAPPASATTTRPSAGTTVVISEPSSLQELDQFLVSGLIAGQDYIRQRKKLEKLERLDALLVSGQISGADYIEQRKRVMIESARDV